MIFVQMEEFNAHYIIEMLLVHWKLDFLLQRYLQAYICTEFIISIHFDASVTFLCAHPGK